MTAGIILNARGSGNDNTVARIHQLSILHRCLFFGILEPMISSTRLQTLFLSTGYQNCATNDETLPKICVFWRSSLQLTCITTHAQYMTFALGDISAPSAYLTVVYAKCSLQERRLLWEDLISFSASISVPWIVGGDFNAIIGQHEKQGGDPPRRTSMTDFKDFIDLSWMLVSRVQPSLGGMERGDPLLYLQGWIAFYIALNGFNLFLPPKLYT